VLAGASVSGWTRRTFPSGRTGRIARCDGSFIFRSVHRPSSANAKPNLSNLASTARVAASYNFSAER